MYYEEKIIDGVLCHRGLPDAPWTPFTPEQLTASLTRAEKRINALSYTLTEIKEKLNDVGIH